MWVYHRVKQLFPHVLRLKCPSYSPVIKHCIAIPCFSGDHFPVLSHSCLNIPFKNVLLVKIEGPVWCTMYHHLPVVKGVSSTPSINQPTNGKRTSMIPFISIYVHVIIYPCRCAPSGNARSFVPKKAGKPGDFKNSWGNAMIYTYIHTYMYIYVYICICMCMCTYIYIFTYVYVCVYYIIYTVYYIYITCIYIYMCVFVCVIDCRSKGPCRDCPLQRPPG